VEDDNLYLLAGGREQSDWIRNLQANPQVTVELGDETHDGRAHVLQAGTAEDQRAREMLVGKYLEGNNLDEWGRTALPVVIGFKGQFARPLERRRAGCGLGRRASNVASKGDCLRLRIKVWNTDGYASGGASIRCPLTELDLPSSPAPARVSWDPRQML
jgi:deazaflavin-dependent oxidoreductase (nitroreductase family)